MIFLFNVFSICQIYNITNQTMKTLTLKSDDELILNVTNSDYFIHVQNHYFYGTLEIQVFNTTTNMTSEIKAIPGDRLHFTRCALRIRYSKSSICRISFWVIDTYICRQNSIHYSGISSAYFELSNDTDPFTACYFFESPANPKISSDRPIYFDSRLYFVSDNESIVEKIIVDNITDFTISKLSILRESFHIRKMSNYRFSLTTDLKFADFTDKDSYFKECENDVCDEPNITAPGFVIKRKVIWWMWLIIYMVPSVLLTLGISLMFINRKKETSLFSSTSKPLISETSKASLLSLF